MSESISNAFAADPSLPGTVLEADQARVIREGLQAYRHHCGCEAIALVDPSGALLVQDGNHRDLPLDALGVMTTASFSATRSLAQILGDPSFGGICHQGEKSCLYVAPLVQGFMLMALFQPGVDLGGIRSSLVKVVQRLNQLIMPPAATNPTS